jgi:hypothetical protein
MTDQRQSPTMIRNFDPALWERVKTEARRHDLSAGALLTLIVGEWMDEHQCASVIVPLDRGELAST